jgi:stress-induced morphogen
MIESELKELLEKKFDSEGDEVIVENQSHLHDDHAGSPKSGQSHFHVRITSEKFTNQPRVKCHQMVNTIAQPLFEKGLHALSLSLNTKS